MAYCYRVILVGEFGVGKTSLFRRFKDDRFEISDNPKLSIGLDNHTCGFRVGRDIVQVELWDTGGMERVASMNLSYFRGAHGAILCFSPFQRQSFDYLSDYMIQIEQLTTNCRMFLCETKTDLGPITNGVHDESVRKSTIVSEQEIKDFEVQCADMLFGTFRTSSKTNEGVEDMFQTIGKLLHEARSPFRMDSIKLEAADYADEIESVGSASSTTRRSSLHQKHKSHNCCR